MMILDLNCQRACMKGNQIHVDLFKNRKIRADEKGVEYQHIYIDVLLLEPNKCSHEGFTTSVQAKWENVHNSFGKTRKVIYYKQRSARKVEERESKSERMRYCSWIILAHKWCAQGTRFLSLKQLTFKILHMAFRNKHCLHRTNWISVDSIIMGTSTKFAKAYWTLVVTKEN